MEVLVKNRNFPEKSKVFSKIEVLVKNRIFFRKNRILKFDVFALIP